jgi:hypothetical protein
LSLQETLAANCHGKAMIKAEFFEFARLCHPRLRENATRQAIGSEMIVVTARRTDAVPEFVQKWMRQLGDSCLEKTVSAEFLLAMSAEPPDSPAPLKRSPALGAETTREIDHKADDQN